MPIIRKVLLILPLIFIGLYSQSAANEVKKIGKYKDWESMVIMEDAGKVCFAQSSPILQAPKSNKRDAKLFIAFRPAGLNAINNFASLLFDFGACKIGDDCAKQTLPASSIITIDSQSLYLPIFFTSLAAD